MNEHTKKFYDRILMVMQECEEAQGPEGIEYVLLMTNVSQEASMRANNCLLHLDENVRF